MASYVATLESLEGKRVVALDIGSGGGVVGLSLARSRAWQVERRERGDSLIVFNDIDPYSLAAAALNVEEGGLEERSDLAFCVDDLVGARPDAASLVRGLKEGRDEDGGGGDKGDTLLLVLCGDILYDRGFGSQALDWLRMLAATGREGAHGIEVEVLLGDPGRHVIGSMPEETRDETLELVFECDLPRARDRDVGEGGLALVPSDGFTSGRVWRVRAEPTLL